MDNTPHLFFDASDRSYLGILKKDIHTLAVAIGFTEQKLGELDIVVAELASNLLKYGANGKMLVKQVKEGSTSGIEILSIDNGPGMSNIHKMLEDGFSTQNTLGHGLGSMKRLADHFQIYSHKGWGTIVLVRIFEKEMPAKQKQSVDIKSLLLAKPGETACGDGFYAKVTKEHIKILLGDGLGHGPDAAFAVGEAIKAFKICPDESPVSILRFISSSVKKTRGLVASVAVYNIKQKTWKLAGVGNISAILVGNGYSKNYLSYNGIIGMNVPNTMNEQLLTYEKGQMLILCSDGIKSKWDLSKLPGIMRCDPSIIAAAIYKDFARNTDDMSVAVIKLNI